jgi:polynucleotide 5'-kinase involved in rRNA processing
VKVQSYLPKGQVMQKVNVYPWNLSKLFHSCFFFLLFSVKIPEEIFKWDIAAQCRYAECARKGTQTIHRARAMIVGCAGAGKSTLLKRLQKRSLNELKQVSSTVGLEVHEDIFEIDPEFDCLKGKP